jgi:hypothetical protein
MEKLYYSKGNKNFYRIFRHLLISIILLVLFTENSLSQIKECDVRWIKNGQSQYYSYVNAGQTYTIERDPGTAVSFSVWPITTASYPRTYYLTDWSNGITVNSGSTTAGVWYFDSKVGSAATEVWLTVNVNSPMIKIAINNYVPPKPDLTVTSVTFDGSTQLGNYSSTQSVAISCRVDNNGSGIAAANSLGIYLGTSSSDYSNRVASRSVAQLNGLTGRYIDYTYSFKDADAGSKYFLFKADYTNVVVEEWETNNTTYRGPFQITLALPAAPSNPTATVVSSSQINLSFTDNSNNETGFKIERKIGASGSWTELVSLAANTTSYSDLTVNVGSSYSYRVYAYSNGGNSLYSNEINVPINIPAIIVTVDGLDFNNFLIPMEDVPPHPDSYLRPGIMSLGVSISENDLIPFPWNQDARATNDYIPLLKICLRDAYKRSIDEKKKFIVISHSWGTILSYLALSYESTVQDPIKPDLFITLSSPLGTEFAHQKPPYYFEKLIMDYVSLWFIKLDFKSCDNCYPRVSRWVNYWAWGDLVSGPVDYYNIFSTNIQVDPTTYNNNPDYRNYSTTLDWHWYTSLQNGGSKQNQPIKDQVKNEILQCLNELNTDKISPVSKYNSLNSQWYSSNPIFDIDFLDNLSLNTIQYQIDSNDDSNSSNWHFLTSDGSTILAESQNNTGSTYTADWNINNTDWNGLSINGQNVGKHYLYFKVTDDAGNIYITPNQASAFEFRKDNIPPNISFNSPIEGQTFSSTSVQATWSTDDLMAGLLLSGLEGIYISIDQTTTFTKLIETTRNYTFDNLQSGHHIIYLQAKDNAGNYSNLKQVGFTIAVVPVLTTSALFEITTVSATSGGNISSDGGGSVTARGVCWSTVANPTITLTTKTSDGTGSGVFTSNITGLTAGTLYHVKAYATNSAGTAYGADITFTTGITVVVPTLTTTTVSPIAMTTATSGGNISSDGGGSVTARGVCWSTAANPTITLTTKTSDGTGSGVFTSNITGLTAGTAYHVRAYATNSTGTAYGADELFTTLSGSTIFILNNDPVTTCSGTFYDSGGEIGNYLDNEVFTKVFTPAISLNKMQFAFSSFSVESGYDNLYIYDGPNTSSPQFTGSPFTGNQSIGIITASGQNLSGAITFRFTSDYSITSTGWAANISCISPTIPSLTTTAVSSITMTSASSGGNVIAEGIGTVSARGVCWSTTANPTITLSTKTNDGNGVGAFTSSITGLTPGSLYHVRSYATNSSGTAYGPDISFNTLSDNQSDEIQDNYVLDNIMTGLKIVERIKAGTMSLNVNQSLMQINNYNSCTKIGDYIVYSVTAQSLDPTDWSCESNTCFTGDKVPVNLQFKFAWKSDGTVYIGAVGTDNEILAAIADGSHWTAGGYKGERTFFEGFALQTELKNMKNSSMVEGIPHVDSLNTAYFFYKMSSKIFNRFNKPIYRIFSSVVLLSSPNTEIYDDYKDWCPYAGLNTGTGKRSFSLSFTNNTNSYVCATASNDNSNSSYVKIDGTIVAQKSKYADHYYRQNGIYPSTIELGTTIVWSSGNPRFSMAVVCDNVISSNLSQTPSGGLSNNHEPIIISIPVYINITTGLEEVKNSEIRVYPNPVSGFLNIEYQSIDFKTINIYNSSGSLIGKEKAISPRQQLDFSKYEYGFYMLEFVKTSGEKKIVKVINH